MRAIVIERFGGPECLGFRELPDPEPISGHAVIEVKAFGINHAELHMRRGEWAEAAQVSGIECVVEREGPRLSHRSADAGRIDAVLDLVGNRTILDSLELLRGRLDAAPA